jgi:hypothetical protein
MAQAVTLNAWRTSSGSAAPSILLPSRIDSYPREHAVFKAANNIHKDCVKFLQQYGYTLTLTAAQMRAGRLLAVVSILATSVTAETPTPF